MTRLVPSIAALGLLLGACGGGDTSTEPVDRDGDGASAASDCDDRRASVGPSAEEVCDGLDNDCDGEIDEADATDAPTWYLDYDGDGYGGSISTVSCTAPHGWLALTGDCDDYTATIAPGVAWNEPSADCQQDADGDGWADASAESPLAAGTDCDDTDPSVSPSMVEECDGVDTDCDGVLPDEEADADADGYVSCDLVASRGAVLGGDCDDTDPTRSPGVAEVCNDGDEVDDDCNGYAGDVADTLLEETGIDVYRDADGDGYGAATGQKKACTTSDGWVDNADDCDDSRASVAPGADDVCDGLQNDCTSTADADADADAPCPASLSGTVQLEVLPGGADDVACAGDLTVEGTLVEALCPDCVFTMRFTHSAPSWDDPDTGSSASGLHCDNVYGPGTIYMGFSSSAGEWHRLVEDEWRVYYTGTAADGTYTWSGSVDVDTSLYDGGPVSYDVAASTAVGEP